jgi:putative addiction module CopG family antidote
MEIELTPEQSSFVDLGIEQGRYLRVEDAVQDALQLWVERERTRLELLAAIDAGDDSPESEDIVLESDKDIAEFVKGIAERGRAKLAAR